MLPSQPSSTFIILLLLMASLASVFVFGLKHQDFAYFQIIAQAAFLNFHYLFNWCWIMGVHEVNADAYLPKSAIGRKFAKLFISRSIRTTAKHQALILGSVGIQGFHFWIPRQQFLTNFISSLGILIAGLVTVDKQRQTKLLQDVQRNSIKFVK